MGRVEEMTRLDGADGLGRVFPQMKFLKNFGNGRVVFLVKFFFAETMI